MESLTIKIIIALCVLMMILIVSISYDNLLLAAIWNLAPRIIMPLSAAKQAWFLN